MRTLPLLVAPVEDETLLSFCRRLAAHNQGSLTGVLTACGLGGGTGTLPAIPDMAIVLDRDVAAGFAEATGITAERTHGLLLGSYRGAIDTATCPPDGGPDLLHWSRRHGLLGAGSHACPTCLSADGAFRMAWRFHWSFACPDHGLLLEAACPRCHRPFSYDDHRHPTQSSRVPQLAGCGNQAPPARARTGLACRPCGHQFNDLPVRPTTNRITQAHRRVRDVCSGSPATVHGQNVSAAQWRVELANVVAIVAQLAEPDDLGELGVAPLAAFHDYVAAGRSLGRSKIWQRSADPALLAAVVPAAVELLAAPSPCEFDDGLAPLVRRGFETRFPSPNDPYRYLGVRGLTLQAWARVVGNRQSLTTRIRSRYGGTETRPDGLALLPQMLWPEVFDQRFARFLPDVDTELRRRFCSLALGVLATKGSYVEVAAGLGLPRRDNLVRHMNRLLRDRQEADEFYQALVETARWLDRQAWTVDYGQRRRSLADLTVIADGDWRWACSTSGIHMDCGSGQRHSSTWLWCALTGGESELAPSFAHRTDRCEHATYIRFVNEVLPTLQPALVAIATIEMQRRKLVGPVRADLSGWEPSPQPDTDHIAPTAGFE